MHRINGDLHRHDQRMKVLRFGHRMNKTVAAMRTRNKRRKIARRVYCEISLSILWDFYRLPAVIVTDTVALCHRTPLINTMESRECVCVCAKCGRYTSAVKDSEIIWTTRSVRICVSESYVLLAECVVRQQVLYEKVQIFVKHMRKYNGNGIESRVICICVFNWWLYNSKESSRTRTVAVHEARKNKSQTNYVWSRNYFWAATNRFRCIMTESECLRSAEYETIITHIY